MTLLINTNYLSCPAHQYEWREHTDCMQCISSAMNRLPWGSVICFMDEIVENNKTEEQKEADRKQQREEEIQRNIRAHDSKTANKYTDRNGKLTLKIRAPCKWYCHNGHVGEEHPAENGYEAGCRDYKKNKCPFYHPDEVEWQNVISEYKKGEKSKVIKLTTTTTYSSSRKTYKK